MSQSAVLFVTSLFFVVGHSRRYTMADTNAHHLALLADDFLQHYFDFYPSHARLLGLHEYDGRMTDLSPQSVEHWVYTLHHYQEWLAKIDPTHLGRLEWFDYQLLRWQINAEWWQWTTLRDHERNPIFYVDETIDDYVKRDYAPLEERAQSLAAYLGHIPRHMDAARIHLSRGAVPRILIEESIPIYEGMITFLTTSLDEAFGKSSLPPAIIGKLWRARDAATTAIRDFLAFLQHDLLPNAQESFAIGTEHFLNMLRYNELINLSLDELLALGERDLANNQAAIARVAAQIDPSLSVQEHMKRLGSNHPPQELLLSSTRSLLNDLKDFVKSRDLVTMNGNVVCRVEETPPFARWAFAMMDTAGPFEQVATDSFYYVTLPDPNWSPEEVQGWLTKFDTATLTSVSVHEAFPGHFVHFNNTRNAPTHLAKVFRSYSHFESWAHYVEQMMLEEGYGRGDLRLQMAQLSEALVRNCRFVCGIKMHTQGMTLQEATRFFMENGYMDEVTARNEARRGTHDTGYINYTLGKILLLQLREEYKQAQGDNFSLKTFHDKYIGYGSPPIPLLREMLVPTRSC
jgi:uncharacterized protein (DUF885 family)